MLVVGEREDALRAWWCRCRGGASGRRGAGSSALGVEPVIAQPVVPGGVAVAGSGGFRGGLVVSLGLGAQRAVRALVVVIWRNSSSWACTQPLSLLVVGL